MNELLKAYIAKKPKYKLVFDLSASLDVESVNAGAYLAGALQTKLKKNKLDMYAGDAIRMMLRQHTHEHPELGRYVALENIGIIYEPELAFNLESIFEQTSKDELLIIRSKGKVEDNRFFFLSPQQSLSINLNNLTYLVIE